MDYTSISSEQIGSLVAEVIATQGNELPAYRFTEEFLRLLEDVPGLEAGECSGTMIGEAWVAYTFHLTTKS